MPPAPSTGPAAWDARLAGIRFRRALTLLLMTLVLPGSAQLVAGNKALGRVSLRVFWSVASVVALVVLLGLAWPGFVYWLLSSTAVLAIVRFGLVVLAVGWGVLFLDAWRLGQPLELRQKQRLAMVGLNGFLCLSVAGSLLFASHVVAVQRDFIAAMFGDGTASGPHQGRYNVLLLGGDAGADRWGMRPDSITVASIDADTGRTVLFGLPRNMQNFPFPDGSIMQEQFPDGFDCEGCYLNGLITWAADNTELFAGHGDPGMEAIIQGVEGITGLKINYHATVNLQGFKNLVDAVGGIRVNVRDRIPIGGIGAPVTGHIEPGVQRLDGYHTLWFARSRTGADDYSRMARQKCVMHAMLGQLSPQVVVTKFQRIAEAGKQTVETDLPASELDTFIDLALKAKGQRLSTVSFVPPLVNTARPDIALIRERVEAAVTSEEDVSEDEQPARRPRRPAADGRASTGGSIGSLSDGYLANDTDDLAAAC